jgi:hypothetical protein
MSLLIIKEIVIHDAPHMMDAPVDMYHVPTVISSIPIYDIAFFTMLVPHL